MGKRQLTPESITTTANRVGPRLYIGLNFSYGFVMESAGKKTYKSHKIATGIILDPADWSEGWFSPAYVRKNKKLSTEQQASILALKKKVFAAYAELLDEQGGALPTPDEITERISGGKSKKGAVLLVDYARKYMTTIPNELTRKKFRTLCVMLECFEQLRGTEQFKSHRKNERNGRLFLHLFDRDLWTEFGNMIDHAAESIPETYERGGIDAVKMVDKGFYKTSTKNKYQSSLQTMIKQAQEDGLRTTIDVSTCKLAPCKSDEGAFLKYQELAVLFHAKMEDARLENSRKLFVLNCSTGVRYGDLIKLLDNPIQQIEGDEITFPAIQYGSEKTGTSVCMPLFHHALDILTNDRPYIVDNATLDLDVHEIAKLLGFDRVQSVKKFFADQRFEFSAPKLHEELTVHSGRRSYVTLCTSFPLFLSDALVSRASGHTIEKSRSSFGDYKSLSPETAAEHLLIQASYNAHRLPFKLLPDAVSASIEKMGGQRGRVA